MTETTYIYDKKEFVKTGRTAIKTEKRGTRETSEELVEIRPVNVPEDNKEYNLWVKPKELFEVTGN